MLVLICEISVRKKYGGDKIILPGYHCQRIMWI